VLNHFGEEAVQSALNAAGLGVFLNGDDAACYFYASEAMILQGRIDDARLRMQESAERASPDQATQGRRSIREFGQTHKISTDLIEEFRDLLGEALSRHSRAAGADSAPALDSDPAEGFGLEAGTPDDPAESDGEDAEDADADER
jgi:hypothetical protein